MDSNMSKFNYFSKKENENIFLSILGYLDYNEIIGLALTCKELNARIDKQLIKKYVRNGCISSRSRNFFWINNIKYKKMEDIIRKEIQDVGQNENLYRKIIQLSESEKCKEDRLFVKILEEINKDLNRTFYIERFLSIDGQRELGRILTALAYIRPEIGYCQGMNFIAGALLHFLTDEEIVFWVFLALLDDLELNSLYYKNMPDYSIRIYQLNFFLKKFSPELFYHFKKEQINPDIFFSKWILTIFSSYLPFETLAKVWDVFLIDKWKAIFKFSLAFLAELHDTLIKLDLNSFSQYVRDNSRNLHLNNDLVLANYKKFKITNSELTRLREDYFVDQLKKKLDDPNSLWETDQTEALMIYKKELDVHENESKKEISLFQHKMEELNKECVTATSVYQAQAKLCAELKIKLEELVESKSAYENVIAILSRDIQPTPLVEKKSSESLKGKSKSSSKKKIYFTNESSKKEYKKISKKLKSVTKELQKVNKKMLENYKQLDKKMYIMEKVIEEKNNTKQYLEKLLIQYEIKKQDMIKNCADRLKLSEKFVKTSAF